MSTKHGTGAIVQGAVAVARAAVESEGQAEQAGLFDEPDSEDIIEARQKLGAEASHLAVVREARAARAGRKAGSRNRRTDDLVAYLAQFGPDPAVAAMRIIAESEELMIERSKRPVTRVLRRKNGNDQLVTTMEPTLTFEAARAIRMRMVEHMTPYWHGKKPVQVDMTFSGLSDLVIAGVTHSAEQVQDVIDAEFLPLDDERGEEE